MKLILERRVFEMDSSEHGEVEKEPETIQPNPLIKKESNTPISLEPSPDDSSANTKIASNDITKEDDDNKPKSKWARRADVVNKTLLRALKKTYSKKLWPNDAKIVNLNSSEAIQTWKNIDDVGQGISNF